MWQAVSGGTEHHHTPSQAATAPGVPESGARFPLLPEPPCHGQHEPTGPRVGVCSVMQGTGSLPRRFWSTHIHSRVP